MADVWPPCRSFRLQRVPEYYRNRAFSGGGEEWRPRKGEVHPAMTAQDGVRCSVPAHLVPSSSRLLRQNPPGKGAGRHMGGAKKPRKHARKRALFCVFTVCMRKTNKKKVCKKTRGHGRHSLLKPPPNAVRRCEFLRDLKKARQTRQTRVGLFFLPPKTVPHPFWKHSHFLPCAFVSAF